MDPYSIIANAVEGIVSSVSGTIDRANAYYTAREENRGSTRTSGTLTRGLVLAVVAVAIVFVFIKLSKSE
ncbi:MAG: hypothetical protein JXR36_01265 [Bacteroidales bacterium]|nr:hypothetical protein [Bacteroidales bacterium]